MPWFEAAGFIVFGFFVGTYGSMVGVGGGFLIVPLLLFLGAPARVAAGTSLAVVLANSTSSTLSYLRQKRVDVKSGLIFSAAGVPGALLGAYADQHVPHRVFTLLFGLLLVAVAVRAFLARDPPPPMQSQSETAPAEGQLSRDFVDAQGVRHSYRFNVWGAIGVSAATGFLASMFGIGGGVVQVPAMVYLFGFPTHIAVATSQLVIAITSAVGTASHAYYGDIMLAPAVFLAIGAIAGAQVGAHLASRLQPGPLMRWFSLAVAAAALYLIYSSAFKH
ncbi:MAG TPA: sulfite exporter TauE/SafE family protein [Candidatus Eremiobacteraceae bacterium]|nr:sulfite exporter TauE/SafE family protein [Candidatus Eremiobacteraceae bacterium]